MRPNEVIAGTIDAIVVFISQKYRERAELDRNSVACSINGSDSIGLSKYHTTMLLNFVCRFWLRSTVGPRMSAESYRFSHCLPSIARKAEEREAARLEYRMD